MDTAFVKPRLDDVGQPVLVRQPERSFAPLPAEGADVPLDDYWHRRLRDGDVIEVKPPAVAEPAPEMEPELPPAPADAAVPSTTEEA